MSARFKGKIAVVTGGGSGLGEATAERFVAEGGQVVIVDKNGALATALAERLGKNARAYALDITEEAAWADLAAFIRTHYGRLDILAHCAGAAGFGSIEDLTVDQWHLTMNVNGLGTVLANRFAVELMRENGGAIVNVASANGVRVRPGMLPYSASKAAVISITRCVALHCAAKDYGIRCNAVLPGAFDTPLIRELADKIGGREALEARAAATHALKRMGQSGEIAAMVLYLASDDASFMTATAVPVDGGMLEL